MADEMPIVERLLRTRRTSPILAPHGPSHLFINPDGPEAAEVIKYLCDVLRPFADAAVQLEEGRAVWIERPVNETGELLKEHFLRAREALSRVSQS